jgi:eukaryotic-like serine/threonine-protein kinase
VADVLEQLRAALGERYEVERLVGEGGMATVYLAKDLRHGRKVAVKTLRAELAASIGADRFLREIRLAANLQHPNILGLYDSGEAGGILYYVMPFIEGESLRARLDREQQLPIQDAVRITREAAEALAYAHDRGVIHRDIKPENILLQNGHALVADFGIARALDAAGEKLTQTGMAVGTPHYMSPEQAMGADHADGRSDVYSLGCVLYELLAGQPPFDGSNARAILARHTMEQVPSITVVRPSVPDEVEDAVLQSLEKTPADRYQKMSDFADALADLESAVAVRRTTPRGVTATRRTMPRRTGGTRVAQPGFALFGLRGTPLWAVVGLLLVAGAGLAGWRLWGGKATAAGSSTDLDARRVAVLYFENEGADSLGYLADGLTEGLIRQLSGVQTLDVISSNGVALYRGDSIPRDSIARVLKVGTLVHGSVGVDAGRTRVTVRLVDSHGAEYQRASFALPASDVFRIQDSLMQEVAQLIRQRLGEEIKLREQQEGTSSPAAWALVQRAEQARKRAEASFSKAESTAVVEQSLGQADSLYARAQAVDPGWVEPVVGRAEVAYRRSRLVGLDGVAAIPWIEKGEKFANEALSRASQDPDGLEVRGTLRYWKWLLNLEPEPRAAERLLEDAERDLETSVKVRPSQAGAWAILSHMYSNTKGETDAKLAGLRALEADAYLRDAPQVINRLFTTSYDLGQFVDAARWCQEGARRFPENFNFTKCQLWVMSTKVREPDVTLAWKLADSLPKLSPGGRREYDAREARMIVAMVLARAGLADSALAVANRSRGGPEVDPNQDLAYSEVYVHILRGDKDRAFEALKSYLAANPERRSGLADTTEATSNWWFRDLEDDPRFRGLVFGK